MVKNRFFKTTAGVPFEFAVGDTVPVAGGVTAETSQDVAASGTKGEVRIMRVDPALDRVYTVVANTALAAAYRKQQVYASYCTANGTVRNTIPMIAETVTAQVVSYSAPTLQVMTCTNAGVGVVSTQQHLNFKIIETTPGIEPLPKWSYTEFLTLGEGTAWANIAAKINAGNDNEFFTAVAGATGITITSTDATRHFKLAAYIQPTKADPVESGVTYTIAQTTGASEGSGTLAHVERLFNEANVKAGVSHYYSPQGTTPEEFGLPGKVADMIATTQFDIVVLSGYKTEASPLPKGQTVNKVYIFIAVPTGEGSKISAIFA